MVVTKEWVEKESAKEEKAGAKLLDPDGEELPTVDESSGCQDPPKSISRPGWYSPRFLEKILFWSRGTIGLGCSWLQKEWVQSAWCRDQELLDAEIQSNDLPKAGLFIPGHVEFLLQENMTSVV